MHLKQGLSLIEITISMAILILVMLPSFLAFSSGRHGIQMTESEFRAHNAALEVMEQTLSLPFSMLNPGYYDESQICDGKNFGETPVLFRLSFSSDYKPTMQIEDIKKKDRVIFKKITVSIKYPIAKGSDKERDFSLKVMVNNDGI